MIDNLSITYFLDNFARVQNTEHRTIVPFDKGNVARRMPFPSHCFRIIDTILTYHLNLVLSTGTIHVLLFNLIFV